MDMNERRRIPLGVVLIAGFYVFGAMVLIASMFTNPAETSRFMAERHGLPPTIGVAVLPIVAALALVIAYGLYSLSRWGFYLTLAYLLYFGGVSLTKSDLTSAFAGDATMQVYFGNLLWSTLVVIYLFIKRRHFLRTPREGADSGTRPRWTAA
jgi:hypothetical protein